jgi:hypothetical protein
MKDLLVAEQVPTECGRRLRQYGWGLVADSTPELGGNVSGSVLSVRFSLRGTLVGRSFRGWFGLSVVYLGTKNVTPGQHWSTQRWFIRLDQ